MKAQLVWCGNGADGLGHWGCWSWDRTQMTMGRNASRIAAHSFVDSRGERNSGHWLHVLEGFSHGDRFLLLWGKGSVAFPFRMRWKNPSSGHCRLPRSLPESSSSSLGGHSCPTRILLWLKLQNSAKSVFHSWVLLCVCLEHLMVHLDGSVSLKVMCTVGSLSPDELQCWLIFAANVKLLFCEALFLAMCFLPESAWTGNRFRGFLSSDPIHETFLQPSKSPSP